jgi:hypothetical protein
MKSMFNTLEQRNVAMIRATPVYYDGCTDVEGRTLKEAKESYKKDKWKYVGQGRIHKINGVVQHTERRHYFFQIKRNFFKK